MPEEGRLSRRQLLSATGAAGLAGFAGCTGDGGGQEETPTEAPATDTPGAGGGGDEDTATPTPTETPSRFPEANDNEVHFLTDYSNDPWQKVWENQIVPKFKDETDIPVNIEYVGFQGTGEQRLTTLLQAGDAPESFTGNIDQVGDMFIQDQLQPVVETTEYLAEQNGEVIAPKVLIDGKNYVVPHGVYTSTIHYRTDIFDQLDLDPPDTWEQYRKTGKIIDEDKSIDARGLTVSAPKAGMSTSYFQIFYIANGAWLYDWNEDRTGAEIWFPEDKAIETLEYFVQLAEYSPDPASINWGSFLKFWAGNRIAQGYHLNGWAAGVAANAGVGPIAENTDIVPIPKKKGVEPLGRSSTTIDGHPIISVSDNPGGALQLVRWMYANPEKAAKYYLTEPTRFIPAYADIFEADNYKNAEIFQEFPNLLELNLKSRDEMAPLAIPSDRLPETKATIFAGRFPILAEMMNQVIVADRPPKPAVKEAKDRYKKRLEEGRKK